MIELAAGISTDETSSSLQPHQTTKEQRQCELAGVSVSDATALTRVAVDLTPFCGRMTW